MPVFSAAIRIACLSLLFVGSDLLAQVHYNEDTPWSYRAQAGPDTNVPGWFYNLGLTGLRVQFVADQPKALLVKYVFPKSPADGHVKTGDLIVGTGGQAFKEPHRNGYGEKVFGAHGPISELAQVLEACQSQDRQGKLPLTLLRGNETVEVELNVGQKYGTYSSTYPAMCPKSDAILTELLDYLVAHQDQDGSFGDPVNNTFAPLALLASGDPKYLSAVERNAKFHGRVTEAKGLWLVNWSYTSAAIVLSEYYLATKAEWVLPKLQKIHDLLAQGQYLDMAQINPKAKKSHPDSFPKGPRDSHGGWGHNPGFEGYGPIAMLTGQGALAYSLMHRCGITIDRKKHDAAYEFIKRGTGKNGYVWYGDQVGGGPDNWADMGRTGAAGIANYLSPYQEAVYRERALSHAKIIGIHPESFADTHGSPPMGMAFAALTANLDPESFRKLMDANRWWFTMAQCPDGSFYYQPNRDNAGYGSDSRTTASAVVAFIFSIPKHSLVITGQPKKTDAVTFDRETREISGWHVHIAKKLLETEADDTARALAGLKKMLDEIVRDVPAPAVAELKKVPLYFSTAYQPGRSGAEFHPGAGWLRENGRDPAMVLGVEFSGVHDFEAEMRRMPNFALHELAHAFHYRVLPDGFGNAEIKAAYERAKSRGHYEQVERSRGDGKRNTRERAYAMTNAMEYFAESTEAYFARNDFFPFTRDELKTHDPEMCALLEKLWGVPAANPQPESTPWLSYPGGDGPGKGKRIVLISAEQEYRSEQSMPMMAKILSTHHGFDCIVLFGVNKRGEVDPTLPVYPEKGKEAEFQEHDIPGLEHLASADLVIFFTRLLTLPQPELEQIVKYVDSGKPIIALRTANHGFRGPLPYKIDGKQVRWGEDILGGTFLNHHGRWHADSTRGTFDKEQTNHPILAGVSDIWGDSDVYRTYKEGTGLPSGCTPLVWGQPLMGRKPDDPPNDKLEPLPVAWVKPWQTSGGKTARVFHSTMGSGTDLKNAGLRRLIVNAAYWCMGIESSISATRSVDIVGSYQPLESGFNYDALGVRPRPVSFYR